MIWKCKHECIIMGKSETRLYNLRLALMFPRFGLPKDFPTQKLSQIWRYDGFIFWCLLQSGRTSVDASGRGSWWLLRGFSFTGPFRQSPLMDSRRGKTVLWIYTMNSPLEATKYWFSACKNRDEFHRVRQFVNWKAHSQHVLHEAWCRQATYYTSTPHQSVSDDPW